MNRIRLARNIGFCNGVRRAIAICQRTLAESKGPVYSLGSVIHNPEVISRLEKEGLVMINSLDEAEQGGTLILPSHGSPRKVREAARKRRLKLVDVTCPYVSSVQKICLSLYEKGGLVVIVGDRRHPEVRSLLDYAPTALIVERAKDVPADRLAGRRAGVISQTTQSRERFFALVSRIMEKNPGCRQFHVYNTICLDTLKRQEEVKQLAGAVDRLLVIGSATSANTKRLLRLGRKVNKKTFLVEHESQVNAEMAGNGRSAVGIISGASAPTWLVTAVVKRLKKLVATRTSPPKVGGPR